MARRHRETLQTALIELHSWREAHSSPCAFVLSFADLGWTCTLHFAPWYRNSQKFFAPCGIRTSDPLLAGLSCKPLGYTAYSKFSNREPFKNFLKREQTESLNRIYSEPFRLTTSMSIYLASKSNLSCLFLCIKLQINTHSIQMFSNTLKLQDTVLPRFLDRVLINDNWSNFCS